MHSGIRKDIYKCWISSAMVYHRATLLANGPDVSQTDDGNCRGQLGRNPRKTWFGLQPVDTFRIFCGSEAHPFFHKIHYAQYQTLPQILLLMGHNGHNSFHQPVGMVKKLVLPLVSLGFSSNINHSIGW